MKKTNFKLSHLICAVAFALVLALIGCSDSGNEDYLVSSLDRPVALDIAMIEWTLSPGEEQLSEQFAGLWEQCLGRSKRPFAFVANSGGDSVARIDLCTGEIKNSNQKGNPFVVSHIPVGHLPSDVAVSIDEAQSRVFVTNSGDNSLSVIESRSARTLPETTPLPGRPLDLIVGPSPESSIGQVYITLPDTAEMVIVVQDTKAEKETWKVDQVINLQTDNHTEKPLPSALALHPDSTFLYIADLKNPTFMAIDLSQPTLPPRLLNVGGPQRAIAISPDGRFAYLAKLDERKIAAYDLVKEKYIDTNEEFPSHRNQADNSAALDYDIELQSPARQIVFANIAKSLSPEPFPSDDTLEGDGDQDEELGDSEIDGDDDSELTEDEEESESETTARFSRLIQDENADDESEISTETQSKSLYAYSIGYNGIVQVIDVNTNLHELFDTSQDAVPRLEVISRNELDIDIGLCLADIDYRVYEQRTPDALWEFHYNATLPNSDRSVSGYFDFEKNRLYDDNFDFASLPNVMTRSASYDEDDPYEFKPDLLVIDTPPLLANDDRPGCIRNATDENGEPFIEPLTSVSLEITDITTDYIEFDSTEIDLKNCFNTYVDYSIRAQNNYLVFKTLVDQRGAAISPREYAGRARNTQFVPGDTISSEDQFQSLKFERDDWSDFVCVVEIQETEEDPVHYEYHFREDLGISGNQEVVDGTRCVNPWDDNNQTITSFENEELSLAICQDPESTDIISKQNGSFIYAVRTFSGTNEIRQVDLSLAADTPVGILLEDAVFIDAYNEYPRLYVLDTTEEMIYIIDAKTDELLNIIL